MGSKNLTYSQPAALQPEGGSHTSDRDGLVSTKPRPVRDSAKRRAEAAKSVTIRAAKARFAGPAWKSAWISVEILEALPRLEPGMEVCTVRDAFFVLRVFDANSRLCGS
jgi:hypothetical protein